MTLAWLANTVVLGIRLSVVMLCQCYAHFLLRFIVVKSLGWGPPMFSSYIILMDHPKFYHRGFFVKKWNFAQICVLMCLNIVPHDYAVVTHTHLCMHVWYTLEHSSVSWLAAKISWNPLNIYNYLIWFICSCLDFVFHRAAGQFCSYAANFTSLSWLGLHFRMSTHMHVESCWWF